MFLLAQINWNILLLLVVVQVVQVVAVLVVQAVVVLVGLLLERFLWRYQLTMA
jgi:hypothetical protein